MEKKRGKKGRVREREGGVERLMLAGGSKERERGEGKERRKGWKEEEKIERER